MEPLSPLAEIEEAARVIAEAQRIGDAIADLARRTPQSLLAAALDMIAARLADCSRGVQPPEHDQEEPPGEKATEA